MERHRGKSLNGKEGKPQQIWFPQQIWYAEHLAQSYEHCCGRRSKRLVVLITPRGSMPHTHTQAHV